MANSKTDRSLTEIINRNKLDDLSSRIDYLEDELKRKELLLIHLEKMSSLGQFIKEIIHELKNPLSAISGFTELGKIAKSKKDRNNYLDKIPGFINQISSRLSQFRTATVNTGVKYEAIDLLQILAENLTIMELLKPKGTAIESTFGSESLKIMGDPEQWTPVFLGICKSFFIYMKEIKSNLNVKAEVVPAELLLSKISEIDVAMLDILEWKDKINKTPNWIKINFENKKIIIPRDKILKSVSHGLETEDLQYMDEPGIVIACDIIKRHQGNIYTKKRSKTGFSLNLFVPSIT